jgi:hypothetical protein
VYTAEADTEIEDDVSPVLHNNDPVKSATVNKELSQLLATATTGARGIVLGAATPDADALLQPFTNCITVYVPGVDTVMEEVVAPLLHSKEPVKSEAVNTELPQLSVTVTFGVATTELIGEASPLPAVPVQPSTVCVTEYMPSTETVMEAEVAPLFQSNEPVKPEAVRTALPQLFTTDTVGAGGVVFGAAVPLAVVPVQPSTV